jgi:hypothetical protein
MSILEIIELARNTVITEQDIIDLNKRIELFPNRIDKPINLMLLYTI